ncbi:MAG: hypothetical protein ACM3P0_09330 [Acidobacteriota bacterium]
MINRVFVVVEPNIKKFGIERLSKERDLLTELKSFNGESCQNVYYLLNELKSQNLEPILLTWSDIVEFEFCKNDLVIIPQWYITSRKFPRNEEQHDLMIDNLDSLTEIGAHIILLHRSIYFWDLLDETSYSGKKNGMHRGETASIRIESRHPILTKGLDHFLSSNVFHKDYFEFIYPEAGRCNVLVSKTVKNYEYEKFIGFGYYEEPSESFIFIIDVGFVGDDYTQTQLFELLLRNTLHFLKQHVKEENEPVFFDPGKELN